MQTPILLTGITLLAVAAYGDVKTLRIPNLLVAAVAALGVARLAVIGDLSIVVHTIAASVVVLVVAFLLFSRNLVGGGDAKLISAASLLVGYHDLLHFLLVMSLCGGLVSLAVLVSHRRSSLQPRARMAVPYGVAIAGGGIVTLLFQPSLLG